MTRCFRFDEFYIDLTFSLIHGVHIAYYVPLLCPSKVIAVLNGHFLLFVGTRIPYIKLIYISSQDLA